ncbi:glycosyltransferase involved in cell wall biosynthesis [Dysgonomonas alginatilytica]|uniref:Glycosyltransferase involved in cell wall biosynthesis n=1 Tax=Dysgonomonas alginatilytica TaxID=1605892 RepID=A0A2V3PUU6_9BACT|nr:glycosyltransferase [Dysgonomonas alginatilytica]PXV63298.1 glycosyltransferase involved in cell wall biosynthesis [Dysgonomonas alginatilytica]
MISICIPIYNTDVTNLVTELHLQCEALDAPYEILLIDDASDLSFQTVNRELSKLDNIHYKELPVNISRAKIRNLFPQKAAHPYLIYVDNDAQVCSPHYISTYIKMRSPGIVCYGGCEYLSCKDNQYSLRWLFGVHREAIPIEKRKVNPDEYFSTFNFMIDKRVVLLHPFDENIEEYGYEDVVFHTEIIKQGHHITQVNNPLIHTGLISNEEFLKRTESALRNLYLLQKERGRKADLENTLKLLKMKNRIDYFKLTGAVSALFRLLKNSFIKNLLGKKPSLFILDLYKLGYLCNYSKR